MQEAQISFKGTVNGLTIILREEDEFEAIINQLEDKVKSAGKFFKGATLSVLYRGKELTKTEEDKIYDLLSQKSGANILSLNKETVESNSETNIQNVQYQPPKLKMNDHFFKGIDQGPTKFHRGTVRSGQLVSYAGNLVIVGDVNPGGEVVANGNVVVLGALKGMVHAGADGNRDAIVIALNLQPMQLRIADVITRSPDGDDGSTAINPEVASVKDDRVIIVGL
jgi:septum site-determining protein MinC